MKGVKDNTLHTRSKRTPVSMRVASYKDGGERSLKVKRRAIMPCVQDVRAGLMRKEGVKINTLPTRSKRTPVSVTMASYKDGEERMFKRRAKIP